MRGVEDARGRGRGVEDAGGRGRGRKGDDEESRRCRAGVAPVSRHSKVIMYSRAHLPAQIELKFIHTHIHTTHTKWSVSVAWNPARQNS